MTTSISTTNLGKVIGVSVSIKFLENLGFKPVYRLGYQTAMWNESDIESILLEMGLHFINKAKLNPSAPHGYKKNGEPALKRGRKEKHVN